LQGWPSYPFLYRPLRFLAVPDTPSYHKQGLSCGPFPIDGNESTHMVLQKSLHAFISTPAFKSRVQGSWVHDLLGSRCRSAALRPNWAVAVPALLSVRRAAVGGIARSLVAQQPGVDSGPQDSKRLLFVGNLPWVLDSYGWVYMTTCQTRRPHTHLHTYKIKH